MASLVWNNSTIKHAAELGISELSDNYPSQAANLIDGSQLGAGIQLSRIDAATPLVLNPAVIIVTSTPSMWDGLPYTQKMLKSMVETHAKSITGIEPSYTLETASTPVGWDGQELKVPTRTTRAAVDPVITWNEVTGNLCWNMIRKWIWDIQHPDTNASLMTSVIGGNNAAMPPFMMSSFSMSIAVIQYDMTMRPENIIDGLYISCMFPTTTGDLGIERTHGTSKPMERSIPFTGILQQNENTKWLAQELAQLHQFHKVNYNQAIAGPGAAASTLQSLVPNAGQQHEIENVMQYFKKNSLIDGGISTTA